MQLRLERPDVALVPSYLDFLRELAAVDGLAHPFAPKPDESHEAFVARVLRAESAPDPPAVPQTTFWATIDARVVGQIGLRHRLNAALSEYGGHVGYSVRPSHRRRGVAKEMLRRVLELPEARAIGKLLLTCAPDNVASNRAILASGGVLEKTIFVERIGRETNLYWITL